MAIQNSWNNTITNAVITLNSTTNAINISSDASATTVNIGTGGAAKTITVGSTTGASSLALKCGTSDLSVASATGTVMSVLDTGEITKPLQPAFSAYLAASDNNVTGAGTTYQLGTAALTEAYDQNSDFNVNGTFAAPVTGIYSFCSSITVNGCVIATTFVTHIDTSNAGYSYRQTRFATNPPERVLIDCDADMDAADTAVATITVSGEGTDTVNIFGTIRTSGPTYFCGYLVC